MIYPNWTSSTNNSPSSNSTAIKGTSHTFDSTNVINSNGSLKLILEEHPPADTPVIGYRINNNNVNIGGEIVNTFVSTSTANGYLNPVLTSNEDKTYTLNYVEEDSPTFTIDDLAYSLFLLGTLTCSYLPQPSRYLYDRAIECPTVISDNSLTLRTTPVPLFQRPITVGEDDTTWWMSWGYSTDSPEFESLMQGQPFILSDRIFGLTYHMYKSNNTWTGNNSCLHVNGQTGRTVETSNQYYRYRIVRNDINITIMQLLKLPTNNLAEGLYSTLHIARDSDGLVPKISEGWFWKTDGDQDIGECVFVDSRFKNGDKVTLSFTINDIVLAKLHSTFTMSISGDIVYPQYETDTVLLFDFYNESTIEPMNELKLYMLKAFTVKDDTNLWDGVTNPWTYINNVDGYNITPDPSSSQALISPYTIISNGVMLAENLESHTYRINDIGNDVTLINSQIKNLTAVVQNLSMLVDELEQKTKHFAFDEGFELLEFLVQVGWAGGKMVLSESGIREVPALSFADDVSEVSSISTSTSPTISDTALATSSFVSSIVTNSQPVKFIQYLVTGNWPTINSTIVSEFEPTQIVIFQTSYDKLKPLTVIIFPSVINHNGGTRNESTAIACPCNSTDNTFYLANVNADSTGVTSIYWGSVPLTRIEDATYVKS